MRLQPPPSPSPFGIARARNRGATAHAPIKTLVTLLATFLAATGSARAGDATPECVGSQTTDCIAHLFTSERDWKVRSCFPARYLEIWRPDSLQSPFLFHEKAGTPYQTVDAAKCEFTAARMDALRHYMGCADPTQTLCEGDRPWLGISLEGGGSKSAPFALGVLAGLEDAGLLSKAQWISSVSGGSYAAHYFYSRWLDQFQGREQVVEQYAARCGRPALAPRTAWFADCISEKHRPRFGAAALDAAEAVPTADYGPAFCKEDLDTTDDANFCARFETRFPFQHHLRQFQDVLYPTGNLRVQDEYLIDTVSVWRNLGALVLAHAVTLPYHYVSQGIFDWNTNISPSRLAYYEGIERAYGHGPTSFAAAMQAKQDGDRRAYGLRADRSLTDLAAAIRLQTDACRRDGRPDDGCAPPPTWILGTVGTSGRDLMNWFDLKERDPLRLVFEITPFGQGSGTFGFRSSPPGMYLRDAVGASSAFLDQEQRAITSSALRLGVNAMLYAVNADWTTRISNYNSGELKRAAYSLAPWPTYTILPSFQRRTSPYILLTDGGNADNLGLLALLRRGVRNVVVSASTDDRTGEFPSLCKLKNQLELDGTYALLMPELTDFAAVCNQQLRSQEEKIWGVEAVRQLYCHRAGAQGTDCDFAYRQHDAQPQSTRGYPLWNWSVPVLRGCVVRQVSIDPRGDDCAEAERNDRLLSWLFVVKPAVDLPHVQAQLEPVDSTSALFSNCSCGKDAQPKIRYCKSWHGLLGHAGTAPPADAADLPCEALAFLVGDACEADGYPKFPQHNFLTMTLNSDYLLFGAYYDLARTYAGSLRQDGDRLLRSRESCGGGQPCMLPTIDLDRGNLPKRCGQ